MICMIQYSAFLTVLNKTKVDAGMKMQKKKTLDHTFFSYLFAILPDGRTCYRTMAVAIAYITFAKKGELPQESSTLSNLRVGSF